MSDPIRPPAGTREVARVGRSHGLDGAVRVQPIDEAAADALASAQRVWIAGLGEARVVSFAPHGREWLLRVDRVRRVETAKSLVHAEIRVPGPVDAPPYGAPDALIGRPVAVDGHAWGEVVAVEGAAANPLLRVRGPAGERILPLAAPYVVVTDDGVAVVDPPQGLLDTP